MFHPNHTNLISLFEKLDKTYDFDELEKSGSSLLKVRYSSRDFIERLESGNYEMEFRIKPKKLKCLGSEYKLYTYIILRLLKIKYKGKGLFATIFEDFCEYLNKRTFSNNERYFYLSQLTDNMFCYEIDTILSKRETKRNFYRILYSRITMRNNIRLIDMIIEIIQSADIVSIPKNRPKFRQRIKGYRDHGSMGSEYSKTLKDQSRDWSIQEEIRLEEKEKQDFIELCLGLQGWI